MIAWIGLGISIFISYFVMNLLGKPRDTKVHLAFLFGLSFYLLLCVVTRCQEEYHKVIGIALYCFLLLLYVSTISYKHAIGVLGLIGTAFGCFAVYRVYSTA
jgi:Ca2+/Na+ antiporter